MSEFYAPESIQAIREQELEMETYHAMLEMYDPYIDDDFICSYCEDEEMECEECGTSDFGNEDAGMEGYLFGWDS
jgi:hypothetical protein